MHGLREPSAAYRSFTTHSELNLELLRLASPQHSGSSSTTLQTFSASLPSTRDNIIGNEDRCVVQRWNLPSGEWTLACIFDGHAGVETAEYALTTLPSVIRRHITPVCSAEPLAPEDVATRLGEAIRAFDDSLIDDLCDCLPEDLEGADDAAIRAIINDQATGGRNYAKVVRCMRGCTALVALVDPSGRDCWVANLGDGQAVLAERSGAVGLQVSLLSNPHNGSNPSEVQRVRSEHPGEPRVIFNERILGVLTTTRALGDHTFKLPAAFTQKVFLNARPGVRAPERVRMLTEQMHTPPYVSSVAEVVHRRLQSTADFPSAFALILSTDGLTDLYADRGHPQSINRRLGELALPVTEAEQAGEVYAGLRGNKALHVLKDALGDTLDRQSTTLTSTAGDAWMDDTTVIVLAWH